MSEQPNGLETLESECAIAPQVFDFNFRELDGARFINSGVLPAAATAGAIVSVPPNAAPWYRSDGSNWLAWAAPSVVMLDATSSSVVETLGAGEASPVPAGVIRRFARSDESPSNTVTVQAEAPQTLDGVSGGSVSLANGEGATFVHAGGGSWYRLA